MSLVSKREAVPSIEMTGASTLVVVAESEPLRRHMVAAMAAAGFKAPAVARQEALAEYELDARTVLILSCDVLRAALDRDGGRPHARRRRRRPRLRARHRRRPRRQRPRRGKRPVGGTAQAA